MTAAAPSIRERIGAFIAFGGKRAEPISFSHEATSKHFGHGLGSSQPDAAVLLRENRGVSDIATRAIANRIGTLDPLVKVTRDVGSGTTEDEILDDHALRLLLLRPHPDFTTQQLLRLTGQYIVTVGEAYWLKIRNGFQVPAALQPMPAQNVSPVIEGGFITSFIVRNGQGRDITVPRSEVIRFWFPDPETLYTAEGYLGPNAVNHDANTFASEHLRSQYQNDATPPIILKGNADATPMTDPQWARYQSEWARKYSRRKGQARGLPAAVPTGWDVIQMAVSSGADITPLLEFWQSNELMNFGVPASVLGRVVSGDRSSAETNQFVFDSHTIAPIAHLIEDALTLQLAPDYDDALFVEFDEFMSADKDFELRREAQDLQLKVRSIQQVITDRAGDPEAAPWGELPVGSFADAPYDGTQQDFDMGGTDPEALGGGPAPTVAPEPMEDEPEPPRSTSRQRAGWMRNFSPDLAYARAMARERKYRPRMERAVRSVIEAQRKEVLKQLTRGQRSASDAMGALDPSRWVDLFLLKVEPIRRAAYQASAAEALDLLGSQLTFEFLPTVTQTLNQQAADLVTMTSRTTRDRLRVAITEGTGKGESVDQLAARINDVFAGRRKNARTIARTELLKATEDAQIEGFRQSGVVEYKRWNDNRDPEVRDSHVMSNIPIVPLNQPFTLGNGNRAMYPGDSSLPVEDIANCRCFVTPEDGPG